MNSKAESIISYLDSVSEHDFDETGSMQRFAQEAARVAPAHDHKHEAMPTAVSMHNFPNADFYYKLVAKVNGRLFSIYDGKTEYAIGKHLCEPVQAGH